MPRQEEFSPVAIEKTLYIAQRNQDMYVYCDSDACLPRTPKTLRSVEAAVIDLPSPVISLPIVETEVAQGAVLTNPLPVADKTKKKRNKTNSKLYKKKPKTKYPGDKGCRKEIL